MTKYGRCMSKQEAKKLKKTMELYEQDKDLIPVFDSPRTIEDKLRNMNNDSLKNYFRRIGVRNPQTIVFFDINDSINGIIGPIPQTNRLREYKVPKGTNIDSYDLIRL